jgi:hypothetical protein
MNGCPIIQKFEEVESRNSGATPLRGLRSNLIEPCMLQEWFLEKKPLKNVWLSLLLIFCFQRLVQFTFNILFSASMYLISISFVFSTVNIKRSC